MIDRKLNGEYTQVIKMARFLKPFATNLIINNSSIIWMQPKVEGCIQYFIPGNFDFPNFRGLMMNIWEASRYHSKFKKSLSELSWEKDDSDQIYLIIKNQEMNEYRIPVISDNRQFESLLVSIYSKIPGWKSDPENHLIQEPDYNFIESEPELAYNLAEKKQCSIDVDGTTIYFSRPFLGDTKKTYWIGYRVIYSDDKKVILKFKQREDLGNVYTYAAFLRI